MSDSEDKMDPSPKSEETKEESMEQESGENSPRINGNGENSDNKDSSENKKDKVEEKIKEDEDEKTNENDSSKKETNLKDDSDEEKMETNTPTKSNTKQTEDKGESPKKNKKKETKKVESESEEEEDEEPKLGLLEQPVVIESGKREKKKVERLSMTEAYNTTSQPKEIDIPEGLGDKLGDIPRIEFQINKFKAEDMKTLHRVLFGKVAAAPKIKKNIRQFNGFEFKKDDKEYKKRRDMLVHRNFHMPMLKTVCEVLDLEKKGTKEDVVDRVVAFCMCPKSSGKKLPQSKKRKRSDTKGKGEKKTKKDSKASKKKKSKEKVKGSDDEEDEEEEEDEKSEEEEEEEEEKESEEEEEEPEPEEAPKKKKAKKETPAKKPAPKAKKEPIKKKETPKKKAKVESSEEESEESSDDEVPLVKKAPSAPTNDELKKLVKKILDGANLEQVTMKTVVKQVYDKYPTFDLSDRKQFIKSTVKQFLS